MKERYTKKGAIKKWDVYYSGKNIIPRIVDSIMELYFCRIFEKDIRKITNNQRGRVIELGCGSGVLSAQLAQKGYDVTVLDISTEALKTAKRNFLKKQAKGKFIQGDILDMHFKPNSFDIVWNQGVIEHFDNIPKVVSEMYRLVKKSGYLIVFVPAFNSPLHMLYRILNKLNLKSLWPFDDQIFFTKKELLKVMSDAGIKSPRVRRVGYSLFFSLVGYSKKK